jgi:glutathione synthase/RimK-type ligase-like ATP-grasp enzyme
VKTAVNENAADDNESATHLLCEEVVEAGARAAGAVGVRLAGVDVITVDPARPLADTGGVVLEVNTTPGFYYHYHKRGGEFPVALHVLKTICSADSNTHGVIDDLVDAHRTRAPY